MNSNSARAASSGEFELKDLAQETYEIPELTKDQAEYPFRVIHLDIITGLVLLATLGYLLRPSVGKRFHSIEC
jgi:hypothetical protein